MRGLSRITGLTKRLSVRARLFAYLIVLTGAALATAGLTAYTIESARVDNQIADTIAARTEAFVDLASGPDPSTGEPFASAEDLMREAMVRVVATRTESAVAHDGRVVRHVPSNPGRLRLEDDEAFLAASASTATDGVVVRAVETEDADYRYAAVPIVMPDGETVAVFTIATDRGTLQANLTESFQLYALVAVLALVLIGVIAWTTTGRALRPIAVLEDKARHISEHALDERIPVEGHDDLAHLARAVNSMLDRLERAFVEQQRLLDDASHELRTPLAIMRSQLELLEPRDPEEIARSQAELLDEVSMMSRLVDDLVTLAKSDRPEFVQKAPVELAELTEATFARATALAERDWQRASADHAWFRADGQRLTQAWLQLAANAVKFSPVDSPIVLGSDADDHEVHLWVRDQGVGIAPEDQERVRDRFHRVNPDTDGAGLGLTIVTAIAAAHGGRLDLVSEPGAGSTFTICVPREKP